MEELNEHLYSLSEHLEWIPYVTSYYKERWRFCMTHSQRMALKNDSYHVVINSSLFNGSLSDGELLIFGRNEKKYSYRLVWIPEIIESIYGSEL